MDYALLLYGATGFTGQLIAAEFAEQQRTEAGRWHGYRMILAGRDGPALKALAEALKMDFRVFGLDDREDIVESLYDVDVVINAAGPFAWTAERLVKAALDAGSHYVDINGEVDVYRKLDDLGWDAEHRDLAIVCSAGQTAAASDLLLDAALKELLDRGIVERGQSLGSIRFAMARIVNFSRGSAQTVARSLREQVVVVRKAEVRDAGPPREELMIWHEPVGRLERTFDFRDRKKAGAADLRIASAANLVDTLTARHTVLRRELTARTIESYVETNRVERIGYQLGALFAPMSALPWVRAALRAPTELLPQGPDAEDVGREGHSMVLEIEDVNRSRIIDWRWETPNVYQLTAQLVVEVAAKVAGGKFSGWRTPAEVLERSKPEGEVPSGALRGCSLDTR